MSSLDKPASASPFLDCEISEAYLKAVQVVWENEFGNKHEFDWDLELVLWPISQLLGLSMETSLKGLLASRGMEFSRTHNLEELLDLLNDQNIEEILDDSLAQLPIPTSLANENSTADLHSLECDYRSHRFHIAILNKVYSWPYASRYPIHGAHNVPAPTPLILVIQELHRVLNLEKRKWKPPTAPP